MNYSSRTLVFTGILFAATLSLGVVVARLHLLLGHSGVYAPTIALTRSRGLVLTAVFIVGFLFLVRVLRSRHVTLSLMLLVGTAVGAHYAIDAFRALPPVTFLAALFIAAGVSVIPFVLTHDIGIIIGVAGGGALLGVTMSPAVAVSVLVIASAYDAFAVSRGYMTAYARYMVESDAVFGFIVPTRVSGFFRRRDRVLKGESAVAGTMDVGMPVLLAASVSGRGLTAPVLVAIGALFGLILAHFLVLRHRKDFIAALPPIATGAILGYGVALLLVG